MTVTFGGGTLYRGPGPATGATVSDYVLYSFNAVATTASADLAITGIYNTGLGTELDDVSVVAASTPEPGSLALFATSGLGALSLLTRKRRRK